MEVNWLSCNLAPSPAKLKLSSESSSASNNPIRTPSICPPFPPLPVSNARPGETVIMMWFRAAAVLASLCVPLTGAIFPDEVDHVDFHHALLGTPTPHSTFFHRPSASSNASLLYTLSEKLFIGAVNPRDGSIVWRQDLAKWTSTGSDTEGFLRAADGEFTVVSAAGNAVLALGAVDGKLVWDTRFEDGEVVKDVEVLHSEGGKVGGARDVLALSQGKTGTVRRLDGATGRVKWEYRDDRWVCYSLRSGKLQLMRSPAAMCRSRSRLPRLRCFMSRYNRLCSRDTRSRSRFWTRRPVSRRDSMCSAPRAR